MSAPFGQTTVPPSRKVIIDVAGPNRSGGFTQDGVRAQAFLFFGQQGVDEIGRRRNPAGTHQLAEAGFWDADGNSAARGHGRDLPVGQSTTSVMQDVTAYGKRA